MTSGRQMSTLDFAAAMVADVPAALPLIDDNWDDERDVLLLHQFMFELLLLATVAHAAGDHATAARILRIVDDGLTHGDEVVHNAVEVSFVEHFGSAPGESPAFLSTWPPGLRNELIDQRSSAIGRWWTRTRAAQQDRRLPS